MHSCNCRALGCKWHEPDFTYHSQSQRARERIFGRPIIAPRTNVGVGDDICVHKRWAAQATYHPMMPDPVSLTTGQRPRAALPIILTPNCHIYISPLTTKSSRDHWMERELNISSLPHQVPWDGPGSSLTIPHLTVNICTNFQQLLFQTPANAMLWVVSQRDRRSAGVDQLQPAKATTWRLGPKLSSWCLRFHKLQIQPQFNLVGFSWALFCCTNVLLTLFLRWYACYISTHAHTRPVYTESL